MIDPNIKPGMLCMLIQHGKASQDTILLAPPITSNLNNQRPREFRLFPERNEDAMPMLFLGFDVVDPSLDGMLFLIEERVYLVVDDDWFAIVPWPEDCIRAS